MDMKSQEKNSCMPIKEIHLRVEARTKVLEPSSKEFMLRVAFLQNNADPLCLHSINQHTTIVELYADDLTFITDVEEVMSETKRLLFEAFKMKDMSQLHAVLFGQKHCL